MLRRVTSTATRVALGVAMGAALAAGLLVAGATAAAAVPTGAIEARWRELGAAAGPLGAPVGDQYGVPGGQAHDFAKGRIYAAAGAGRAWEVLAPALAAYDAAKGPAGPLGLPDAASPTAPEADGALRQRYAGGQVVWSTTKNLAARALYGAVEARWRALRGTADDAGLPTSAITVAGAGVTVSLERGALYSSDVTGARLLRGGVLAFYRAIGGPTHRIGLPVDDEAAGAPSPVRQGRFQRGTIYASRTWTKVVEGGAATLYARLGGPAGRLGLPLTSSHPAWGTWRTVFARGTVYETQAGGARAVEAYVLGRYRSMGEAGSYLGAPTSDYVQTSIGPGQRFRYGWILLRSDRSTWVNAVWRGLRMSTPTASQLPYSYRAGCPVGPSSLRFMEFPYYDFAGVPRYGTLVVRSSAAAPMYRVFSRAFYGRFVLRQIRPVDAYGASDERSMQADNTSAFNCRKVTGNPYRLSQHSYGNAIDINPFENPYVTSSRVYPSGSGSYLDRGNVRPGVIVSGGAVASQMAREGWPWGARWSNPDYQHFSSNGG